MKAVNIVLILGIACLLIMFFMFANTLLTTAKSIVPDTTILKTQEKIQAMPPAARPVYKQTKLTKLTLTPLNLELIATFIDTPYKSLAFIKDTITGYEHMYKIGDRIKDAVIFDIALSEVILERDGSKEILRIASNSSNSQDIITQDKDKTTIHKMPLVSRYKNLNSLLKEVSLRPAFSKGRIQGVRITNFKDKSIIKEAGLKENDIVKRINNLKITNPKDAISIYKALSKQANEDPNLILKVTIEREGKIETLTYNVVN